MTTIGVRGLRDGLSRYLTEVKAGHEVTVTEHGTPVAKIVPVGRPTRLDLLRASGRILEADRPKESAADADRPVASLSDLVAEQRR